MKILENCMLHIEHARNINRLGLNSELERVKNYVAKLEYENMKLKQQIVEKGVNSENVVSLEVGDPVVVYFDIARTYFDYGTIVAIDSYESITVKFSNNTDGTFSVNDLQKVH